MTHRILVVDDEPDITALVAYHLAKAGFRVSTAANGPDALKAAREERPDIVILDLMLPGVSGYDVLAELRKREETREVGVILLTARREETDRIRGLSLGADDYLTKPFSPQELSLRVSGLLRRLGSPAVSAGSTLAAGPIAIDRSAHRATLSTARSSASPPPSTSCCSPWSSGGAGCSRAPSCSRWSGKHSPTSRPAPWTCTSSGSGPSWATRAS